MEIKNIIEGLQILLPYYDDPDGCKTGADHDVLYAYSTDKPLSKENLDKMIELGWFQEEADLGGDDEFEKEHYDPEESWTCFT